MQVILLQRVAKLGQMGEVVNVKDGYARNFLLPQGKALRANEANIKSFEVKKAQLETAKPRNQERGRSRWRQAGRSDLRGDSLGIRCRRALRFRHHP